MTKQYKAGCRIKMSSADKMSLNSLNVDLEIYGKEIHGKIKTKKKKKKKNVISSSTFSYWIMIKTMKEIHLHNSSCTTHNSWDCFPCPNIVHAAVLHYALESTTVSVFWQWWLRKPHPICTPCVLMEVLIAQVQIKETWGHGFHWPIYLFWERLIVKEILCWTVSDLFYLLLQMCYC